MLHLYLHRKTQTAIYLVQPHEYGHVPPEIRELLAIKFQAKACDRCPAHLGISIEIDIDRVSVGALPAPIDFHKPVALVTTVPMGASLPTKSSRTLN